MVNKTVVILKTVNKKKDWIRFDIKWTNERYGLKVYKGADEVGLISNSVRNGAV